MKMIYSAYCQRLVHELALFVHEYGRLGSEVYGYYGDLVGSYMALTERYLGCYNSVAEYVEERTTETTAISNALPYYIDYERWHKIWN